MYDFLMLFSQKLKNKWSAWFKPAEKSYELEDTRTEKRKLGDIGENAVCEYLRSKSFDILDRNYNRKWGELDIVAKKGNRIHFVEVKSISREINSKIVSNETKNMISRENNEYRAEDNMHPWKLKRLSRVIQTYLLDKNVSDSMDWQFDLVTVLIDQQKKICKVSILEDIVL